MRTGTVPAHGPNFVLLLRLRAARSHGGLSFRPESAGFDVTQEEPADSADP